jgi:bis(5'-nucleosidyl)-tetraphosphatase
MLRSERSAGVICYRTDPRAEGGRLYLLLNYGRHWDLPKGHLEKGEDDAAAALRELAEETGIRDAALLPGFHQEMVYFFRSKPDRGHQRADSVRPRKQKHRAAAEAAGPATGELIRKTVVFFLAQTARRRIQLSHEHVGYAFLPYEEARRQLTFSKAKKLLDAAREFLDRTGGSGPA